jgi:N-methylhydantoinase A
MILLGVDVGGTFTDLILANLAESTIAIHKVPSTAPDPSVGVLDGIHHLCAREGVSLASVDHLFHGTTVATNAMLEHKGASTGMITTRGYRDIIHIGRHQRPQNYSIMQDIPWQSKPLVERQHRKVVSERLIPPTGEVLVPLNEFEAVRAIRELREEGVEAIAICFLFSYLNPSHEKRVRQLVEQEFPEAFVTTSSEVSSQFREFERFTTTCINAFLGPKVRMFISNLAEQLRLAGVRGDMHVMTSNGGIATPQTISEKPVYSLLSGLAAGVLGGQWVGRQAECDNLITFDVGGTSADIGIVTSRGSSEAAARDTQIAGFPVMVPMIDVHTIGAGGGSIAYVDGGNAFRVGPRSAGSSPGPAAYGLGGVEPTVTDANLVLGRLDEEHFLGGEMKVFPDLALRAVQTLAARLNRDVFEVAEGICTILASNMANAIRSRTIQKGLDPRNFALVAFGGAGPMTALDVASMLKIPKVIVPFYPGITSALGLLTTDLKYDFVKTELLNSAEAPAHRLHEDFAHLKAKAQAQLERDGITADRMSFEYAVDLRYAGQGYELRLPIAESVVNGFDWEPVWLSFHASHQAEYGHSFSDHPIEVVTVRATGRGLMPQLPKAMTLSKPGRAAEAWLKSGETYFRVGGRMQQLRTDIFDRASLLPGTTIHGPSVLFQKDSTTVIPPGWLARVDPLLNVVITREPGNAAGNDVASARAAEERVCP